MSITTTYANSVITYGNPNDGCRHCGTVITRTSANGKVIYHHPGVICCADAIRDQIRYRDGDFARLKQQGMQLMDAITDLERKAHQAVGKEQTELLREADKARAGYQQHLHRTKLQTDGDPSIDEPGLRNELRNLRALLDQMERRQ
jgi:hypothetical protein